MVLTLLSAWSVFEMQQEYFFSLVGMSCLKIVQNLSVIFDIFLIYWLFSSENELQSKMPLNWISMKSWRCAYSNLTFFCCNWLFQPLWLSMQLLLFLKFFFNSYKTLMTRFVSKQVLSCKLDLFIALKLSWGYY